LADFFHGVHHSVEGDLSGGGGHGFHYRDSWEGRGRRHAEA
jgi:hypothetical protein